MVSSFFSRSRIHISKKAFWQPLLICIVFALLFSGCGEEKQPDIITEQKFNPDSLAPFVEPEFPFITTSLDARELGNGFPNDNVTVRCLAIRLGNEAYACFDTDLLRWSVAWTGDFLSMVTMAQVSYHDFHNNSNEFPKVEGRAQLATGIYPGWSIGNPNFKDPRPPSPGPKQMSWGPIPPDLGRYNGVYLKNDEVVLSYNVNGTEIHEKPGSIAEGDLTGFTRTFRIQANKDTLSLVAAERLDAIHSEVIDNIALLYHGASEDSVTAIGLADPSKGAELKVSENRYTTLQISPSNNQRSFTLALWSGPRNQLKEFHQMLDDTDLEIPDFRQGSSPSWMQTVHTRGHISPDTAAYVADKLTLPIPNPWKRNMRAVDLDFISENSAAVVTFDGDVWVVNGIDKQLEDLRWSRYASGLYEPQSIEVEDGEIYVFGREGIVRLTDLNNDGAADYYENFSNLMAQSMETREWPGSLVAAPNGGFYISKGTAGNFGPQFNPKFISGFRYGSRHSGTVQKISPDGDSMSTIATGFRMPYLGIHPKTGVLSASDQQGNFVPSSPLFLVDEGDYYGVPASAHQEPKPEITPPLLWFPHSVDPSGAGQVWVTSDNMGPLSGELVHLSYGRPGLFRILFDSTDSSVQGGASLIPAEYTAPTMKGTVSPGDGQLYVTGFSLWGSNTEQISSLLRIRHTGKKSYLPESFKLREGGIFLSFNHKLDDETATNTGNYKVRRWNYKRTENYGSGHYKLDGSPGEELLPVFSAHVSQDGKGLFLAIPDMQKTMQMQLTYNIKSAKGQMINDQFWATAHDLPPTNLEENGFPKINIEDLLLSKNRTYETKEIELKQEISLDRGRQLFRDTGCIGCHSIDGTTKGYYGPSMLGLYNSKRSLKNGSKVKANNKYIKESILYPERKIVKGYSQEMPSFVGILTDEEIASIIKYIESLGTKGASQ